MIVNPFQGDRDDFLARLRAKTAGAVKTEMIYKGATMDELRVYVPQSLKLTDRELVAIADSYSVDNWGGNVRVLDVKGEKPGIRTYQVRVYHD